MNFVVSQIDSIQRLAKKENSKLIRKTSRRAFRKVQLHQVDGMIQEKESPKTNLTTTQAFDCFMEQCDSQSKSSNSSTLSITAGKSDGSHQICENLDKSEKYYKKFDFFYRRTAFRSMNEFYKSQFKSSHEQWRESDKRPAQGTMTEYAHIK